MTRVWKHRVYTIEAVYPTCISHQLLDFMHPRRRVMFCFIISNQDEYVQTCARKDFIGLYQPDGRGIDTAVNSVHTSDAVLSSLLGHTSSRRAIRKFWCTPCHRLAGWSLRSQHDFPIAGLPWPDWIYSKHPHEFNKKRTLSRLFSFLGCYQKV